MAFLRDIDEITILVMLIIQKIIMSTTGYKHYLLNT